MRGKKRRVKEILKDKMTPSELGFLFSSYDVVGDIAIIKVPEELAEKQDLIAQAIMNTQRHVKTVLKQSSPVYGDLRLRRLEWIAGERKTITQHKEYGCIFKVDLGKCYFSPRLHFERRRIASLVRDGEVVVNMFAGVGCFSILIAKFSRAKKVYSIDINPVAVRYARENIKINKVDDIVVPLEGDAKDVIMNSLKGVADRVLMPLPEKAYEYLRYAVEALKSEGGWIHYYDFCHAGKGENPVQKIQEKVSEKLRNFKLCFDIRFGRVVRSVGPRFYQVVLDIEVKGKT